MSLLDALRRGIDHYPGGRVSLLDFTRFRRHISTSVSKLFECQRTQLV